MTETIRTPSNRVKNWTEVVHYANNGIPACGSVRTAKGWLKPSIATVTCGKCIAMYGADEAGHVDPPAADDPHRARRLAERDARREAREARGA